MGKGTDWLEMKAVHRVDENHTVEMLGAWTNGE